MTTPRGGTYQLILPDGTKAWLNAASSIRYPVVFAGGKREVEVEGEVYFEVAKDRKKPFVVDARDQHIRVLGTHFNVNSYDDESQGITTLLEGSVNVNNKLLSPGQSFSNGKVQNADTEKAIAWTKGITYFNRTGINAMMREVSRWYDIDVEYRGVDTKRTFTGQVPRTAKLSTILKLLSAIDIHYSLDPANKKIVLHP
jgi:ferric-dicitrate binding protein FerR (iron transport regulator)